MVNETIQYTNLTVNYITYLSRTLTEKITDFLTKQGFNINQAWTSRMILLLSLIIFYTGIKLSKPIFKWSFIILSILLIVGLFIPF